MLTKQKQDLIIKRALGTHLGSLYVAVISESLHPAQAIETEVDGVKYYVTLEFGDFCCIFLK